MSLITTTGSFIGRRAADVVHGTRIASTQFAQATKQGYADRTAELAAKRASLGIATKPAVFKPAPLQSVIVQP